jgi:hypothetical protein
LVPSVASRPWCWYHHTNRAPSSYPPRLPLRLVTCRSQTCRPAVSKRIMCMVLHGLDAPPQSGPVLQSPRRVSSRTPPLLSAWTSCRSTPAKLVGVPVRRSAQSSLPRCTRLSVPSQASQEPPAGVAAIAIGNGSVSPSPPYPMTRLPILTSVTFAAGVAALLRPQAPAAFGAAGAAVVLEAAGGAAAAGGRAAAGALGVDSGAATLLDLSPVDRSAADQGSASRLPASAGRTRAASAAAATVPSTIANTASRKAGERRLRCLAGGCASVRGSMCSPVH